MNIANVVMNMVFVMSVRELTRAVAVAFTKDGICVGMLDLLENNVWLSSK